MDLPSNFVGRGYYIVEVQIGEEVLPMLLDTGMTAAIMLLESTCNRLGIEISTSNMQFSIGATQAVANPAIMVSDASLPVSNREKSLPLPPLRGFAQADFMQRTIGEEVGVNVQGILGQGFLECYDIEVNPLQGRLRIWSSGEMPLVSSGWASLMPLKISGNIFGVQLSAGRASKPVFGIVDTGASHSVVNSNAARLLRLEAESEQLSKNGHDKQFVRGFGLGEQEVQMPLVRMKSPLLGGAAGLDIKLQHTPEGRRSWRFVGTSCEPAQCVGPLEEITVAVGNLYFLEELLRQGQDSIGDFDGPAALLGQDLWLQRPLRIAAQRCHLSINV